MYEAGDLKKGLKIQIDGVPFAIVQFEFVKPGKGQALYKCRLKNMITGVQFDKTYRSGEKFEEANLEERNMEYLYAEGDNYCFMNSQTFEQEFVSKDQMGDTLDLLKDNTVCSVLFFDGKPIGVTLPNFMELKVVKSDPWAKGDTATGSTKPAILETGFQVQVPPFVEEGEILKIDTRTKEYVERVKS
ncbi:elongation factor P [Desulforegula conservatrix]|uniref:elongation factor P n=1 Tax=Desulforegula conservatrix TaxID=153026 RepID=UPI00041CEF06|nr:elongation factor P [Desulforegula conservatrix]